MAHDKANSVSLACFVLLGCFGFVIAQPRGIIIRDEHMFLLTEISKHYVTRGDTFLLTKTLIFSSSGRDRDITVDLITEMNTLQSNIEHLAHTSIRDWYESPMAIGKYALLDPSKWSQMGDTCVLKKPFTQGDMSLFADCIKILNHFLTLADRCTSTFTLEQENGPFWKCAMMFCTKEQTKCLGKYLWQDRFKHQSFCEFWEGKTFPNSH